MRVALRILARKRTVIFSLAPRCRLPGFAKRNRHGCLRFYLFCGTTFEVTFLSFTRDALNRLGFVFAGFWHAHLFGNSAK